MRTFTAVILQTRDSDFVVREVQALNLRAAKAAFVNTECTILLEATYATREEAIAAAFANEGEGQS